MSVRSAGLRHPILVRPLARPDDLRFETALELGWPRSGGRPRREGDAMDEAQHHEGPVEHLLREEWQSLVDTERKITEAERRALHALFNRTHAARNANELDAEQQSTGDRIAHTVSKWFGSWTFLLVQFVILTTWIALNLDRWTHHWDNYPFDMLNLGLAFVAACSLPVLLMSQNRQQSKDSIVAEQDYQSDLRQEMEITALRALSEEILAIHQEQREILGRLDQLTGEVHRAVHEVHHTIHMGQPGQTGGASHAEHPPHRPRDTGA